MRPIVAIVCCAIFSIGANPIPGDVVSGDRLNALLEEIDRLHAKGAKAGSDAIEERTLARLNLRPEKSPSVNPGLLRHNDKLDWPAALMNLAPAEPTADARRRAEKFLFRGKTEIKKGAASRETIQRLTAAVAELDLWLTRRVREISPNDYAAGKRFVRLLEGAAAALALESASDYIADGSMTARGRDTAALTRHLLDKSLRIAPAAPGDEQEYEAVHRAFTRYRNALRVASPA